MDEIMWCCNETFECKSPGLAWELQLEEGHNRVLLPHNWSVKIIIQNRWINRFLIKHHKSHHHPDITQANLLIVVMSYLRWRSVSRMNRNMALRERWGSYSWARFELVVAFVLVQLKIWKRSRQCLSHWMSGAEETFKLSSVLPVYWWILML